MLTGTGLISNWIHKKKIGLNLYLHLSKAELKTLHTFLWNTYGRQVLFGSGHSCDCPVRELVPSLQGHDESQLADGESLLLQESHSVH